MTEPQPLVSVGQYQKKKKEKEKQNQKPSILEHSTEGRVFQA